MWINESLTLRPIRLKAPDQLEESIHSGEELVVLLPERGAGKYVSNRVTQHLGAGDVLAFHGAVGGRLCVSKSEQADFRCFCAGAEYLFPLFASEAIGLLQGMLEVFKSTWLLSARSAPARECHRLLKEVSSDDTPDQRSRLLRIAAAILSDGLKSLREAASSPVQPAERRPHLLESVSLAEVSNLPVQELARRLHVSPRHLHRLFCREFGLSASALRMETRLVRAVSLLRDPQAKIFNVAEECGFKHPGLFNACFKRRFGVSPGQWQKLSCSDRGQAPLPLDGESECQMRTQGLCPWFGKTDQLPRNHLCESRRRPCLE